MHELSDYLDFLDPHDRRALAGGFGVSLPAKTLTTTVTATPVVTAWRSPVSLAALAVAAQLRALVRATLPLAQQATAVSLFATPVSVFGLQVLAPTMSLDSVRAALNALVASTVVNPSVSVTFRSFARGLYTNLLSMLPAPASTPTPTPTGGGEVPARPTWGPSGGGMVDTGGPPPPPTGGGGGGGGGAPPAPPSCAAFPGSVWDATAGGCACGPGLVPNVEGTACVPCPFPARADGVCAPPDAVPHGPPAPPAAKGGGAGWVVMLLGAALMYKALR